MCSVTNLMPAVDYRIPGGLVLGATCAAVLGAALRWRAVQPSDWRPRSSTPTLDADGSAGARLVVELAQVLVQAR